MKFKLIESSGEYGTETILREDTDAVMKAFSKFMEECKNLKLDLENVGAEDIASDINTYFIFPLEDMEVGKKIKEMNDDIQDFVNKEEK